MGRFIKEKFSLDLRSLALFRVAAGATILIDLALRTSEINAFYTDGGVIPRFYFHDLFHNINPYFLAGSQEFVIFLFIIQAIFAILLIVGYKTRLVTIVSWFLFVCLINRNPFTSHAGDNVIKLFLFWGMFLPLGARFSFDSAKNPTKYPETNIFSIATFAFIIQFVYLYVFAALLKLQFSTWILGNAVYYVLYLDQWATPIGKLLLAIPPLPKITTYGTLAIELLGPFIYVLGSKKIKLGIILVFIAMHIGFNLSLTLGTFTFAPIVILLALLPSNFWEIVFSLINRKKFTDLTIYYDSYCSSCFRIVYYIKTFLLHPSAKVVSAQTNKDIETDMNENNSWVVVWQGKKYHSFDGAIAIAKASPLAFFFAPILSLPPIRAIGEKLYRYMAKRKSMYCQLPSNKGTSDHSRIFNIILKIIMVFSLLYIALVNLSNFEQLRSLSSYKIYSLYPLFSQNWGMFAPPPTRDTWIAIPGRTVDGATVDAFTGDSNFSFGKPVLMSGFTKNGFYKSFRWAIYIATIKRFPDAQVYLSSYLCKTWDEAHPNQRLEELTVYYVREGDKGQAPEEFQKDLELNYKCNTPTLQN